MSHDQKPVRVRPVKASDTAQRRRGDTAPVVLDNARGGKGRGKGGGGAMLHALLFMAGAAGSGIVTALLTRA